MHSTFDMQDTVANTEHHNALSCPCDFKFGFAWSLKGKTTGSNFARDDLSAVVFVL
jgi:hypothetical protein